MRYSSGEVIFRAEVVSTCAGTQVRFTVRDFGLGVPEEALATLTKSFCRRGEHRAGLGLGLALFENISRSLSGTLKLKNVTPGLEVRLLLPLHET